MTGRIAAIADSLFAARLGALAIEPPSQTMGLVDAAEAYAVQRHNSRRRREAGDVEVGRKIGLTSVAAQRQFGVDQPDLGALWASTRFESGATVPMAGLLFPRIEAELALVLADDITSPDLDADALLARVGAVVPALEIVDSRVADWRVTLADTVADNASGWGCVVGAARTAGAGMELSAATMRLCRNGETVSTGSGAAVLGSPLLALQWAVRHAIELGEPLRAGELILTGAMGPVAPIAAGDHFRAEIDGFEPVEVYFTA